MTSPNRLYNEEMYRLDMLGIDPDAKDLRRLKFGPDYGMIQAFGGEYRVYKLASRYDPKGAAQMLDNLIKKSTGWRREYLVRFRTMATE